MRDLSVHLFLFLLITVAVAGCVEVDRGLSGKTTKQAEPVDLVPPQATKERPPSGFPARQFYMIEKGDNRERAEAAWSLHRVKPEQHPQVIPALKKAMNDPDRTVRTNAAGALSHHGKAAGPARAELELALADEGGGRLVLNAAIALNNLDAPAEQLFPRLLLVLESDDTDLQFSALRTLSSLDKDMKPAWPTMAKLLTHKQERIRNKAGDNLRLFEPHANTAMPALIRACEDSSSYVRRSAMLALSGSFKDNPEAVNAIIGLLDDEDQRLASDAASMLNINGKHLEPAVVVIMRLLNDPAHAANHAVLVNLLGGTHTRNPEAVRLAVKLLKTGKSAEVRQMAAFAIAKLGTKEDEELIKALRDAAANDADQQVREMATRAVNMIGRI